MSFIFHIVFFFNDTATTEIYTLSLHDALPIFSFGRARGAGRPVRGTGSEAARRRPARSPFETGAPHRARSEEHTSELQSPCNLVCRLLLEKKKRIMQHSLHLRSAARHAVDTMM